MNFDGTDDAPVGDPELDPGFLLNDFRKLYGWDKHFPSLDDFMPKTYFRIAEKVDGEWVARWRLMGIAKTGQDSLHEAFAEWVPMIHDHASKDTLFDTPRIVAIAITNYGGAVWQATSPEGEPNDIEDLPPQIRHLARAQVAGEIDYLPMVVVSVVSHDGLAMAAIVGENGRVLHADEIIQSVEGSASTGNVEPQNEVDQVLCQVFGFMNLIERSVVLGNGSSMDGLFDTAMSQPPALRKAMMSFLLRMVATGMESGMFDDVFGAGGDDD